MKEQQKEQLIYESLRQRRNKIATQKEVAPYRIMHNRDLKNIARSQPRTLEKLTEIKGMGPKKTANYGTMILETIAEITGKEISEKETEKEKVFTVAEFLGTVNQALKKHQAVVQGEIGRIHDRGRFIMFPLRDKDEDVRMGCFAWASNLKNLGADIEEGMEVKISGYPEVYQRTGNLNFRIQEISLVGEGALKRAFKKLKRKLKKGDYFNAARKKTIPEFIRNIGVITSRHADAKGDFLTHLGKHGFQVKFHHSRVEGIHAINELVRAIRYFNECQPAVEVLVLTRGGGSWESLQAFNSESVAKAIFSSKIPIITGIGHENDETIADLVADQKASTPTDAAKILSQPWSLVTEKVKSLKERLLANFKNILDSYYRRMDKYARRIEYHFRIFFRKLETLEQNLLHHLKFFIQQKNRHQTRMLEIRNDILREIQRVLLLNSQKLKAEEKRLSMASPVQRLKQGYSIVVDEKNGKIIKASEDVAKNGKIKIKLYKGKLEALVKAIFKE